MHIRDTGSVENYKNAQKIFLKFQYEEKKFVKNIHKVIIKYINTGHTESNWWP